MKIRSYLILLLLLAGCRKSASTVTDPQPSFTVTPAQTLVKTNISVYAPFFDHQNFRLNIGAGAQVPASSYYYYNSYSYGYDLLNTQTDKFTTAIQAKGQSIYASFDAVKTFCVSDAPANYADVVSPDVSIRGGFDPINPALFLLPANGKLTVPAYSFYGATDFGHVDLYCSYLIPSTANYAITMPCYPMGDENGKRWFLDSYGVYNLQPFKGGAGVLDFKPGITALLQMEIPLDKLAAAPDSVSAYHINPFTNVWEKQGIALKKGNYYESNITHTGYWTLAKPVPGVYATVQLQAATGIPVSNTRITVKSGADEIADARTDANGNANIFVPSGRKFIVTITDDHYGDSFNDQLIINDLQIGPFNTASEQILKIPALYGPVSFDATVFNCDGTLLKNGSATLLMKYSKDKYIFPITDGHLKGSNWVSYGDNPGNLIIYDKAGDLIASNFILASDSRKFVNTMCLYGCLNAQKVYCNYYVDSTLFSVTADALSASPALTETEETAPDGLISIDNKGKGIMFEYYGREVGNNYFLGGGFQLATGLRINGIDYTFDNTVVGSSELRLTRRDAAIGGFVEGWFYLTYRDKSNKPHTARGDFRVRRT